MMSLVLLQTIIEIAMFKVTIFNLSDFTLFDNQEFGGERCREEAMGVMLGLTKMECVMPFFD